MTEIKVYTLDEVAEILKVTKRTLYTYVKEGKLKAIKMGKYWRVTAESLHDFVYTGAPISDSNRRKENQNKA